MENVLHPIDQLRALAKNEPAHDLRHLIPSKAVTGVPSAEPGNPINQPIVTKDFEPAVINPVQGVMGVSPNGPTQGRQPGRKWRVMLWQEVTTGNTYNVSIDASEGKYVTWILVETGTLANTDLVTDGYDAPIIYPPPRGTPYVAITVPRKGDRAGYQVKSANGLLVCIAHDYPELFPNS